MEKKLVNTVFLETMNSCKESICYFNHNDLFVPLVLQIIFAVQGFMLSFSRYSGCITFAQKSKSGKENNTFKESIVDFVNFDSF